MKAHLSYHINYFILLNNLIILHFHNLFLFLMEAHEYIENYMYGRPI